MTRSRARGAIAWGVAGVALLAALSIRYERREYRDEAGRRIASSSAILLPWQESPLPEPEEARGLSVGAWGAFGYSAYDRRGPNPSR